MHRTTFSFLIVSFYTVYCCEDRDTGTHYSEGDRWLRHGNFLVECIQGEAKVVKCITDHGTQIDVGTERYYENGIEFSCIPDQEEIEGSGETGIPPQLNTAKCEELQEGEDLIVENLVICCISRRFKACLDILNRQVPAGHFVVGNNLLKFCNIQQNGLKARVEPRGCFNGSTYDNPNDPKFHVKKYSVWLNGDKEYRCGDNGIHTHRCFFEEKPVYKGTATILPDGTVANCE